jgi:hypothetical protein|tara:strand:+ start:421 stop:831 length:411 start_codon:yes stop_codon:yes gene_type:complete
MIVTYSPQLENPPRDKEVTLGFTLIGNRTGSSEYVQFKSGVNRDIDPATWEQVKEMPLVADLLEIGALTVEDDVEVVTEAPKATGGLSTKPMKEALALINKTFDMDLLKEWDVAENRVRVKNAIQKRIRSITEGDG